MFTSNSFLQAANIINYLKSHEDFIIGIPMEEDIEKLSIEILFCLLYLAFTDIWEYNTRKDPEKDSPNILPIWKNQILRWSQEVQVLHKAPSE